MTYAPRHRRPRRRIARPLGALAVVGATAGVSLALASPASAADGGVLGKIKNCESGGSYTAHNPSSSASGAYQFLDSTWRGLSGTEGYSSAADAPASVQDRVARQVLASQGTTPWAASKHCWAHGGGDVGSGGGSSDDSSSSRSETSTSQDRSHTSGRTEAGDSNGRHYFWRDGHLYWTTHWSGDSDDSNSSSTAGEGKIVDTKTVDGQTRYYHWHNSHLYWTTHPEKHGLTR